MKHLNMFAKFGFADRYGLVVIPPVFDEVRMDDYFILCRRGKKWGILKDVKKFYEMEYRFDGVYLGKGGYLWAKENGLWGMMDSDENTLIPFRFDKVSLKSAEAIPFIEATSEGRKEYFLISGEKLWKEVEILEMYEFNRGYVAALGCRVGNDSTEYFAIRQDDLRLFFYNEHTQNEFEFIEELRNDYCWSRAKVYATEASDTPKRW